MKRLARRAERWGFAPGAAPMAAVLLLLVGLGVIYQNERVYQRQEENKGGVAAEILAASVAAPLDFGDVAAAREAVNALRANPQVRTAAVYDREGRLFAGFSRGEATIAATLDRVPRAESELISTTAPVVGGSDPIGTVLLQSAREPLARRMTRYAMIALFTIMAALVAAVFGIAQAALRRVNRELLAKSDALGEANRELLVQIEERGKAEEQLRQAQKMQALGQLTGGIAHDFNNMLTVIQGAAEILQRPSLTEEKRTKFAGAIVQTAARASSLTSQLLAFARRQPLRPVRIDVNEHVLGMVELLDRALGDQVLIRTDLSPGTCSVEADRAQLESAILNIAVNARDAMRDKGGGTLTISTALEERDGGSPAILLAIADTGAGIPADQIDRIFEPFFTTKQVGKGTGLGLSQVYGFANQSGGEVRVASIVGEGTTITLVLPCSGAAEEEQEASGTSGSVAAERFGRILVVDDNEEVGQFAEDLLTEAGFSVARVASGEDALAALARSPVDAVFSDIVMPEMTGLQLAERIAADHPQLPIVLTTGYSEETAQASDRLPIVFKPYKASEVVEALNAALRASR